MNGPECNGSHVPPSWGRPLTEEDYACLAASGITRELGDQALLRHVDTSEGREITGQKGNRDCAGILIPYYWPGEPSPFNYRVRRDNPDWEQGRDGKLKQKRKYLGPPNGANRLYIPPGVTLEQLKDAAVPIVIVEGEKKAVALWGLAWYDTQKPRFIPIAIAGVWNWRGKVGKATGPRGERIDVHGPIADLNRVAWKGRQVLIVFDADVHTNESVDWARKGIARELESRGADVRLINLPENSGVNGVDELVVAWGQKRVLELFDHAELVPAEDREPGQAVLLIRLADGLELFHTPGGEAFARVVVDNHHETWLLRGKSFRRWLVMRFYQTYGKPPGTQALQDAIGVLEAKAQFESPQATLSLRVAEYQGRIYFDLCNAEWQAVEISSQCWRVIDDPPVLFRRAKGMQPLPQPAEGGSISLLRNLINVGDDDNWVLCISWLVAACRAKGPYPILILQGEQGAAKSTMEKFLRRIIDPSIALVRTPPREDRDLLIAANNSWVIAYDNLSGISQWLSDSLCRLATGGGFSTRELYTDSDEVFFDVMRPVILNGIDHLAERADLADRALILNLPHIPDKDRKDEDQLHADFERGLPQILGALFTAVSVALNRAPQIRLASKPRMADFAIWATAAEPALGLADGSFINAYLGNRADAIQETVEADAVGTAILALMEKIGEDTGAAHWEGSCKELKERLETFIDGAVKKSRAWPQTPRGLSGRLRRLVTFLRESGINITFHPKGTKGQRTLSIIRTAARSTATNAVTALIDPLSSLNQSVATEKAGGGPSCDVMDEPPLQPPPTSTLANQLNNRALETMNGEGGVSGGCLRRDSTRPELTCSDMPRD
jgi:hypothetical protein